MLSVRPRSAAGVAMNLYRVTPAGRAPYVMQARSIRHARAFTRHWPRVRIVGLVSYQAMTDQTGRAHPGAAGVYVRPGRS